MPSQLTVLDTLNSRAVQERRLKAGWTSVVLGLSGTVLLDDELVGGDGVAVRDVTAAVDGVPDGEVEAAVVLVGDGPVVGDVVYASSLSDVWQVAGTGPLEEFTAVVGWQGGVAGDSEIVAAHAAVGDAVCVELANAKIVSLEARCVRRAFFVGGGEQ